MTMTPLEQSLESHQKDIQRLLLESGYQRSLVRLHSHLADELDAKVDVLAKKIRTLESNRPKPEAKEEGIKENGSSEESVGEQVVSGTNG